MGTNGPQNKSEEKKIDPPWPIEFNRQSLLAVCNGSGKGADLLYCLLNKTRWEIHNQKLAPSVKVIKFQFAKEDIHKALAKAGKTVSQGTFSTSLRYFNSVGYVLSQPYNFTFEVYLDVLEAAFATHPEQEHPKQEKCQSVKVSKRKNDTIGRKEYDDLMCQFVNLTEMCQSLTDKVSILTEMCQSLTQNTASSVSLEAASSATTAPQSNALERYKSNDYKREKDDSAIASSPCIPASLPPNELQSFAYSHNAPTTDLPEKDKEPVVQAASVGYMQESMPVNPPEKPKRGTRKPKVEQPALIDTSKKAVAYNEAEQRVFDWYCGCDFIHAKPEQDSNKKKHCATLAPFVHSQEEMQDLANFVKQRLSKQLKQNVYLVQMGNMANSDNLNAWITGRNNVIDFQSKKPVLSSQDPNYDINDDFFNGHAQWADMPKGGVNYAAQ